MKTIYLHGHLAKMFPKSTKLDVASPAEAVSALRANFGDPFTKALREGWYRVTTGMPNKQQAIDEGRLQLGVAQGGEIHFHPVIAGAGQLGSFVKRTGTIIAGAVLVGLSFVPQLAPISPYLRSVGITLAVSGVSDLLAPSPHAGETTETDENPSFIYKGPLNLTAEGHPVPLVYGRVRAGSVVVNANVSAVPPRDLVKGQGTTDTESFYVPEEPIPENPDEQFDPGSGDMMNGIKGQGGKGSSGTAYVPREDPNTLRSNTVVTLLELLSEGPIEGLVDGLKSVYLDNTPIENDDAEGTKNFNGIGVTQRMGEPDQDVIRGFEDTTTPTQVGTLLTDTINGVFTVTDANVDAVRISLNVPQLYQIKDSGDQVAYQIPIQVERQTGMSSYTTVLEHTIKGKTVAGYVEQRRFPVPKGEQPWTFRVSPPKCSINGQ